MINRAAMFSSKDETFNTPAVVIDTLQLLGGIGLDPCDNAGSITRAQISYRLDRGEDGLSLSWQGRGLVFVNPPYGREIIKFASKVAREAEQGAEIVSLVPARTDTKWFAALFSSASAICFWRGRLRFGNATRGAPFPSAVFYHGKRADRFLDVFSSRGLCFFAPSLA
jgi:hypothetical protein